ncbi:unnamed protein product, partial [Owenia fusiformis]
NSGCCFDNTISGVPWCFQRAETTAGLTVTTAKSVTNTDAVETTTTATEADTTASDSDSTVYTNDVTADETTTNSDGITYETNTSDPQQFPWYLITIITVAVVVFLGIVVSLTVLAILHRKKRSRLTIRQEPQNTVPEN